MKKILQPLNGNKSSGDYIHLSLQCPSIAIGDMNGRKSEALALSSSGGWGPSAMVAFKRLASLIFEMMAWPVVQLYYQLDQMQDLAQPDRLSCCLS